MHDVFLGRQPIYDAQLQVVAYELLFRSGDGNTASIENGDQATSRVILNTFAEFGLDRIVGEHLAFINLTRGFLLGTYPLPAVRDRLVLEVLEDVVVDAEIVSAVHRLAQEGFSIALDDFIYHPDLQPLVDIAKYIKIDVLALNRDTLRDHVALLKRHSVKLLAEKVESQEDFDFCKRLGFDYFQGYFFCRPNVIRGTRTPANRVTTLRLLAELQDTDRTLDQLEQLIVQDVGLAYRLLRYMNSARLVEHQVDSVHAAVLLLGPETVRSLASLVVMSRIDNKPPELLISALVRAHMSELMGKRIGWTRPESLFTAGLFSVLDALLDMPLEEVVAALPLTGAITAALLKHEGRLGELLRCVVAYDTAAWDEVECPLDVAAVREIYLESVSWAEDIGQALRD